MTEPIRAQEGWFVLHQLYGIDRVLWEESEARERRAGKERFEAVMNDFRLEGHSQSYCYSVWGHKADLAVLLVDPDLNRLNQAESDLLTSLPAGVLQPIHSFASMSEISEYMSQDQDYDRTLREKEKLAPESPEYQEKMRTFREHQQRYIDERLHPRIPPHRVMCFYPMSKRRGDQANWYSLDFERRKMLMARHAITGRKYAGKVKQLVTGAAGLDDWEWGVTLFSDDPFQFKRIVYEMRYDEVSAIYAEFGDFIVGINLEPEDLFARLNLE